MAWVSVLWEWQCLPWLRLRGMESLSLVSAWSLTVCVENVYHSFLSTDIYSPDCSLMETSNQDQLNLPPGSSCTSYTPPLNQLSVQRDHKHDKLPEAVVSHQIVQSQSKIFCVTICTCVFFIPSLPQSGPSLWSWARTQH